MSERVRNRGRFIKKSVLERKTNSIAATKNRKKIFLFRQFQHVHEYEMSLSYVRSNVAKSIYVLS